MKYHDASSKFMEMTLARKGTWWIFMALFYMNKNVINKNMDGKGK
jgi:hypothetical protein